MGMKPSRGILRATAHEVIRAALGTHELRLLIVVALLLASFGWAADFAYEMVGGQWLWWVFPVLSAGLWLWARRYRRQLHARVCEDIEPGRVRGLVMFLSVLRPEQKDRLEGRLDERRLLLEQVREDKDFLARLPWRINLEAIHYHLPRLRWIVVLPSPESEAQLALFDRLVAKIWPDAGLERLEAGRAVHYRREIETLSAAVEEAFRILTEGKRLSVGDVAIDVTSGTALGTTAGVIVALGEGRRIQYVEGEPADRTYRVLQADIRFIREGEEA